MLSLHTHNMFNSNIIILKKENITSLNKCRWFPLLGGNADDRKSFAGLGLPAPLILKDSSLPKKAAEWDSKYQVHGQ